MCIASLLSYCICVPWRRGKCGAISWRTPRPLRRSRCRTCRGTSRLTCCRRLPHGMARAIIHNSGYKSVDEAKAAINCHFAERNDHFRRHPQRAGKKLWGKERICGLLRGERLRGPAILVTLVLGGPPSRGLPGRYRLVSGYRTAPVCHGTG
jgi:hypothetical protein